MKMQNVFSIFRKDVVSGPRGMYLFWLIAFPVLITLVIRLVLGDLFDPEPRLGIVDLGDSTISSAVQEIEGIDSTVLESEEELKRMVAQHDFDAGLILQSGFDEAVKQGENPELQFFLSGESLASNRIILAVTAVDLVRGIAGSPAPVEVITEIIGGGPTVPIEDRLVPLLVFLAVALSGVFLPAAAIIQEKEKRTVEAILITPAVVEEFALAKGIEGFILGAFTGMLTLILNLGFNAQLAANLVIVAVASLVCVPIGLLVGAAVRDMATMFSVWKSASILLFAPAVLFLFPTVPRWVSMFFPTYYFLGPLYDVNISALPLRDTLLELGIAVAIGVLFTFLAFAVSRRMERKLATA